MYAYTKKSLRPRKGPHTATNASTAAERSLWKLLARFALASAGLLFLAGFSFSVAAADGTRSLASLSNPVHPAGSPPIAAAPLPKEIDPLIGQQDALLVTTDLEGKILFSKNADKPLAPASILKVLTALVALKHLGPDYRFETEFYLDEKSNLIIKGYGDPLLVSEIIRDISQNIARRSELAHGKLNAVVLDDTHFQKPLIIPGISSSYEPYDAPNGALCANFNTVNFGIKQGKYVSAEPQTPLLPFVIGRVRASGLKEGRVILSRENRESTLYVGYLFKYFLRKAGVELSGGVKLGVVRRESDRLIYRHTSGCSVKQLISLLLEYSNNFIANQLLIASGAASAPPGTLEKGVRTALTFAENELGLKDLQIVEGSGISRRNRISAAQMNKILEAFRPYRILMRRSDREFYKTGTLKGVKTRAGYIEGDGGDLYRFVVLLNSPGKSTDSIMAKLRSVLN
jgi:D-alanyl-D-alanine carboxypeptidase/D-alanyl-D-alanine-endopeptidase (penicillin-binding protein 4)